MLTLIGALQFWRLMVADTIHISSPWRCSETHMLRIAAEFHEQLMLGFVHRKFHTTKLLLSECESIRGTSIPG